MNIIFGFLYTVNLVRNGISTKQYKAFIVKCFEFFLSVGPVCFVNMIFTFIGDMYGKVYFTKDLYWEVGRGGGGGGFLDGI